jgi:undecaprenyl-diphosphatase
MTETRSPARSWVWNFIVPPGSWTVPRIAPRRGDVIAMLVSLGTFIALLVSVLAESGLTFIDEPIYDWMLPRADPDVADALRFVTFLGAVEILIPTGMFMGWLLCRWYRSWWPSFVMSFAYVGAIVTATYLKSAVHRPEPFDMVGDVGRSFPSGHTTQTAAVWGTIALLIVIKLRANDRRHWALWGAPALAVAANLAVGLAMVYRGSHWATDMLGGYALGAFWMTCAFVWARPEVVRAAARYGRGSATAARHRSPD